jgi:tRNA methyl transferase
MSQDYNLSAVFMRNWDTQDEFGSDYGCQWERDWEDVQKVCRLLDLPCAMVSPVCFVVSRLSQFLRSIYRENTGRESLNHL